MDSVMSTECFQALHYTNDQWFIVEKVSCLLIYNEKNTISQTYTQEVGHGTHFSVLSSYFFHGDFSKL